MSRAVPWPAVANDPRRLPWRSVAGGVGHVIGRALDGLVIGLVVAYVVGVGLAAPEAYLAMPWPVAVVAVLAVTVGIGLVGAAIATGLVRTIERGLRWVAGRERLATHGIGARIAAASSLPARLPATWLGAFAIYLAIAVGGRTVGPLGLLTPPGILTPFLYLTGVVGAMLGASVGLTDARRTPPGRVRRTLASGGMLAGATMVVLAVAVALSPGASHAPVAYDERLDATTVGTTLADPGVAGPYAVDHWAYGPDVPDHRTATVDASGVLPPLEGVGLEAVRELATGVGADALPIAGLAWVPRSDGPFPLVLVVHGNHAAGAASEAGYAYLGEHLASRGFITASIDENGLNGSWAGDWGGREQLVRAWLLLLHLDRWRSWNGDRADPLTGRVDLERVALIGHSRGGEAAAVAAMLAARPDPPTPRLQPWPTGLDVDAVVAIAPSDGQYGTTVILDGVDYLTLSGGYDADARGWTGLRQYARTRLGDDGFKAALYAYRANHGQFNTAWGRGDFGPWSGAVLDLGPLLTAAEQEDLARTSVGAFLEASLRGATDYRGLFRRPMTGREWLPEDIVVVRSADGGARTLLAGGGDRPIDGLAATTAGSMVTASRSIPLRAIEPDQGARGARLAWSADDPAAAWRLSGVDAAVEPLTTADSIRIALADGRALPPGGAALSSLELGLEVTTADGGSALVSLDRYGALPPPLAVRLVKHDLLSTGLPFDLSLTSPAEVVLQTYEIPVADLAAAAPGLRPQAIESVAIRPLDGQGGVLWVGEWSVVPASPPS